MRLLLDANIIVRLGSGPGAVPPKVLEEFRSASKLLVSPIARSEIAIKISIGKLHLGVAEDKFWEGIVSRFQAEELSYNCEHAALLAKLPLLHRDPFDRMIAAQCLVEDVHLATTDPVFVRYGVKTVT